MLEYLNLHNYALVESAELEFSCGFNVVTGESGAGKSILMSAAALLLGGRAERSVIRTGAKRAEVSGRFAVPERLRKELGTALEAAGIEWEPEVGELFLRRIITPAAVRNFINDTPVSARLLHDVGALLIDVHGANEQLTLNSPARQLELLDRFAGLEQLRGSCAALWQRMAELRAEQELFERDLPDAAEADRLRATLEEIEGVAPSPGEEEELESRFKLGANARELLEQCGALTNQLTESDNSIADQLGGVARKLLELSRLDEHSFSPLAEACGAIEDSVSELSRSIAAVADHVELDPESLAAIEERLSAIYTLKRRYAPGIGQILELAERCRMRLREFQESEKRRGEFAARALELRRQFETQAQTLSQSRRQHADAFLAQVREKLAAIGFLRSELVARFTPGAPGPSGTDQMELLFSANAGEELRPLRKIASSGELSRLMLAMKTVLADADAIPTVIFDEIDMNIGGETARRVGTELRVLGKKHQILCISHLAQVAVQADAHFRVEKESDAEHTCSRVERLEDPVPELGRMLGGGASALRHAKELYQTLGRKGNER